MTKIKKVLIECYTTEQVKSFLKKLKLLTFKGSASKDPLILENTLIEIRHKLNAELEEGQE